MLREESYHRSKGRRGEEKGFLKGKAPGDGGEGLQ